MFRVPADPDQPTFDTTTKVSFWGWLTSSKTDRNEWRRRRDAAAKTAETNQIRKADQMGAEYRAARDEQRQRKHGDR